MEGIDGLGEQERATLSVLGKHLRVLGQAAQDVPWKSWASDWIRTVDMSAVDVDEEGKMQTAGVMAADAAFFAKVSRETVLRPLLKRRQCVREWVDSLYPAQLAGLEDLVELAADVDDPQADEDAHVQDLDAGSACVV